MATPEFISAAARIEAAIASILEFAATTGDQRFIERITRLAIKKEIILEMLLDEIGDGVGTECFCRGSINTMLNNISVFIFPGITDTGDVTINGQICPGCFLEGSRLRLTFNDDTPTPNNSFTFVATDIQPPSCFQSPEGLSQLTTTGTGIVTRADMSTVTVQFSFTLQENQSPAATDFVNLSLISLEPTNPFVFSVSAQVPDNQLVIEDC